MKVEQRDQLILMIDALARDFYHPVGEIALSGFKAEKKYLLKIQMHLSFHLNQMEDLMDQQYLKLHQREKNLHLNFIHKNQFIFSNWD